MGMNQDELKVLVGGHAVDTYVESGMKIGLGTGSTAVWAVRRLGELLKEGTLSDILAVATSSQTIIECHNLGIPLRSIGDPEIDGELDVTIDGADEVDSSLCCTKGGGGALLIEKIVAYASKRFIVVVDESKIVQDLGLTFPIPTEVVPEARVPAARRMEKLGAAVEVRMAVRKMGAVITDNGNYLLDLSFTKPFDPSEYETLLNDIPGVVENGLFTRIRPVVLVGKKDGTVSVLN
jgi:ribose 5-phosphate isomerase A